MTVILKMMSYLQNDVVFAKRACIVLCKVGAYVYSGALCASSAHVKEKKHPNIKIRNKSNLDFYANEIIVYSQEYFHRSNALCTIVASF